MKFLNKAKESRIVEYFLLAIIIGAVCVFAYLFFNNREELFFDEILTFQRSAEMNRDNSKEIDFENPEQYINTVIESNSFTEHISLKPENSVLKLPLNKIIRRIVFSEAYDALLNVYSSLAEHSLNFHDSFYLNLIFYVITLFVAYEMSKDIFEKKLIAYVSVSLIGASYGSMLITNYFRFYSLYVLLMLILAFIFVKRIQNKYAWWQEILLTLLALFVTYVGYKLSQYSFIFSATVLLGYIIVCIRFRRFKSIFLTIGLYFFGGLLFLYKYGASIISRIRTGLMETTHMEQYKVALNNLLNRSLQEQADILKMFIDTILYYAVQKRALILMVVVLAFFILIYRKVNLKWDKYSVLMIMVASMGYVLIVSRVTPWGTWRYISPILLFSSIIVTSLFALMSEKKVWVLILLGVIICFNRYDYFKAGETITHNLMENDGPAFAQREEFREKYDGYDSIYLYSDDVGTLYYGAFLWPDNAEVYFTSKDELRNETEDLKRIIGNEKLLLWVNRNDEQLNDSIEETMRAYGYEETELIWDTSSAGRHYVYLCDKVNG